MIVKNRLFRNKIKANTDKSDKIFMSLSDNQMIALSEVFNRYKEVFLAFKTQFSRTTINKIARLSKKYHKPMPKNFWNDVLALDVDVAIHYLNEELSKASNFRLVQIMQTIRERLLMYNNGEYKLYVIRNGKIFVEPNTTKIDITNKNMCSHVNRELNKLSVIYNMCRTQLVNNLKTKACAVKFPAHYNLMCPTSEKNFIGDIPMGTSINLGANNVLGIYWRNDWGTRDFDLSYVGVDGTRVSWCQSYYDKNHNIIYSGDITNAPNGANEVLYFKDNNIPNGIVSINRFNGNAGSKYRIFFGKDEIHKAARDIAITPLAMPMLCGPGAITNAIVLMEDAYTIPHKIAFVISVVVVLLLSYLIFAFSTRIVKYLGETGINVMLRIMGLIIMVIAVEFFMAGIRPFINSFIG
jgi:hypothetical protein